MRIFWGLYLIGLVLDLALGLSGRFRATPALLEADEREYYDLATSLMHGDFLLTPRRTLGFPLLLAGLRRIDGDFLLLQAAISAINAFSGPLLALIAIRYTRSCLCGLVCGLAFVLWPPAIFFGTSLYSETVAEPLFLLTLLILPLGQRVTGGMPRLALGACIGAGLLLGITTHVRPMYLIFVPVMILVLLVEGGRLRDGAWRALAAVAGFLIVILPWSVHMTMRFHHPIVVTSNSGETLSGGLNPVLIAQGEHPTAPANDRAVWTGPGKWLTIQDSGYLTPAELALPYDRQDALLRARTIAWAKAHPGDALYLEARKLLYMWGIYPLGTNGTRQLLLGNVPTVALVIIGLALLVAVPGTRVRLVRLWILPFFVSGVALISWGSWRFRQPADAGLIAFVVIAGCMWQARRRGRSAA